MKALNFCDATRNMPIW